MCVFNVVTVTVSVESFPFSLLRRCRFRGELRGGGRRRRRSTCPVVRIRCCFCAACGDQGSRGAALGVGFYCPVLLNHGCVWSRACLFVLPGCVWWMCVSQFDNSAVGATPLTSGQSQFCMVRLNVSSSPSDRPVEFRATVKFERSEGALSDNDCLSGLHRRIFMIRYIVPGRVKKMRRRQCDPGHAFFFTRSCA